MGSILPLNLIKLKQWFRQHSYFDCWKPLLRQHNIPKIVFECYASPVSKKGKEYLTIFQQGLKLADLTAKRRYVLDHLWETRKTDRFLHYRHSFSEDLSTLLWDRFAKGTSVLDAKPSNFVPPSSFSGESDCQRLVIFRNSQPLLWEVISNPYENL